MYRNTYMLVNLDNIEENVTTIIHQYNQFKYYFGVVKADSYGQGVLETAKVIIKGGVNYLAVALLEEALLIREKYKDIPILCLGLIANKDIDIALKNNITITITSLDYLNTLDLFQLSQAKVHIKINTGMNRLGVSTKEEFNAVYKKLVDNNVYIEGIYSHIHSSDDMKMTQEQFNRFESIVSDIDLTEIPIIHIQASDALTNYPKPSYVNGCRLGIIMYGFSNQISLKPTFKLCSEVIQINILKPGDTVGYNALYKAKNRERIAVIPIGYADGIIRKNTNRYVYINNKPYKVVGNICMDMLFVKIDDTVKLFDKVEIIKDNVHAYEIAKHLDTIVYEILCSISSRVPRIYSEKSQIK